MTAKIDYLYKSEEKQMRLSKKLGEKIELLLKTGGYEIRYEKGNFKGGYCLLDDRKIIVINKFYPIESRLTTLAELAASLPLIETELDSDQLKLLTALRQQQLNFTEA